jgi:hypothetical protein
MNSVILNVAGLSLDERQLYENALRQPLEESQKILVQLVEPDLVQADLTLLDSVDNALEPYSIWADFSDEEVAELESAILDRSESRPT